MEGVQYQTFLVVTTLPVKFKRYLCTAIYNFLHDCVPGASNL